MITKLTPQEYEQFKLMVFDRLVLRDRELRRGQSLYNALHTLQPDIANQICTTELDPFYQDSRIDAFIEAIKP